MNKRLGLLFMAMGVGVPLLWSGTSDFYSDLNSKRVVSSDAIVWEQVAPGNAGFANLLRYNPTIPAKRHSGLQPARPENSVLRNGRKC